LITMIILIVSFAVLLIFFYVLNLRQQVGEQACRSSLVWRNIPGVGFISSVSCESQDVCISMGGACSGVGKEVVEKEITDVSEITATMKSLSEDCYIMTGSGEVEFDDADVCGVCYLVYFDDKIQAEKETFVLRNALRDGEPEQFSLKEPIAIIVKGGGVKGDYTEIITSQYDSESLKDTDCDDYLF